ncbi:hypothetical protein I6I76_05270 [Dermacoccus nishinomiyaensis]|uniref:hypothetical protein n=1 Tax=Dermacoccus nishinomiyaensis TaxID=1274 RepID=UPI000E06CA12|nr:hypothetical protein [Dermacoccus nishinomiyaensis]QQY25536.1 hypothetical protein I6I76_05270 [Dermacoccus nishinomiyaensis]STD17185.1 Uncharacterised protein [Dermacoccus nishinomiyaensis]
MGLFSSRSAPEFTAVAASKSIVCLHCGFDRFWQRRAKLNSAASEFFDLAWASEESLVLTCTMCGSMREFLPRGVTTTPVN